jgi:hypothetical protein
MSDDSLHNPLSNGSIPNNENRKSNSISGIEQRNNLNGDGEEYTEQQLKELHEYLSMLADIAIKIYYDE